MHIQRGCRKAALFDYWGLDTGDWGLNTGDWGLGTEYWVLSVDVSKGEKGLILRV